MAANNNNNNNNTNNTTSFALWHPIAEWLDFRDILAARSVCREWKEGLDQGIATSLCVKHLVQILQQRNCYITTTNSCSFAVDGSSFAQPQKEALTRIFETATTTTTTTASVEQSNDAGVRHVNSFMTLLRVLRVMKYLPAQMAVCYNQDYGRHCFGMKWVPSTASATTSNTVPAGSSQPVVFGACTQPNCPTCHVELPTRSNTEPQTAGTQNETSHSTAALSVMGTLGDDYDIHSKLSILKNGGPKSDNDCDKAKEHYLDLKTYTHQCIPNLPVDLECPLCCGASTDNKRQKRTLMLSEFSYRSARSPYMPADIVAPLGHRTSNVLTLTLPPRQRGESCMGEEEKNDRRDGDPPLPYSQPGTSQGDHKRQRVSSSSTNSPASDAIFPPLPYQDLAIPIVPIIHHQHDQIGHVITSVGTMPQASENAAPQEHQPLHPKPYLKHVMSIHCVECRQFTLLAPAGMCWSSKFDCLSRSKVFASPATSTIDSALLSKDNTDPEESQATTWVGGVLVRTACSETTCQRPVFCHDCSHATRHAQYPIGSGGTRMVQHCSRCDSCHLDYCPAHAWLSTICHHW